MTAKLFRLGIVAGLLVSGATACTSARWSAIRDLYNRSIPPRTQVKTDVVAKPNSSNAVSVARDRSAIPVVPVGTPPGNSSKTLAAANSQPSNTSHAVTHPPAIPDMPTGASRVAGPAFVDPESEVEHALVRSARGAPGGSTVKLPAPTVSATNAPTDEDSPSFVARNDGSTNRTDVVLRPGLVVRIAVHVLGKKEVEEPSRRVGEQGEITLPLLGVVKVAGRTIDELAADLQKGYSKFLVNPQVVVEFVTDKSSGGAMPWGYVTVLGRVKKTGRVYLPATHDLSVSAAIQEAGGLDTSAKDTAIRLTSVNPNGTTESREVNLRAVGSKGEIEGDVILRSGDVIYVPELVF